MSVSVMCACDRFSAWSCQLQKQALSVAFAQPDTRRHGLHGLLVTCTCLSVADAIFGVSLGVTVDFPGCYSRLSWTLQSNLLDVTVELVGCYSRLSWMLQSNLLDLTVDFLGCYSRTCWMLQSNLSCVTVELVGCYRQSCWMLTH